MVLQPLGGLCPEVLCFQPACPCTSGRPGGRWSSPNRDQPSLYRVGTLSGFLAQPLGTQTLASLPRKSTLRKTPEALQSCPQQPSTWFVLTSESEVAALEGFASVSKEDPALCHVT